VHVFTDDSDVDEKLSLFTPSVNLSNVLVYEIGDVDNPGDHLLQRILKRDITSLCVPPPHAWGVAADFQGWLFLKVADEGATDDRSLDYVTVAVQIASIVRNTVGVSCKGNLSHVITFREIRKFAPTRVVYKAGTGPYLLPVGDEAVRLGDRLANARIVESPEAARQRYDAKRPMVMNKYGFEQPTTQRVQGEFGKGTRKAARDDAKHVAANKHMVGVAFQSRRKRAQGVGEEVCCEANNCTYSWGNRGRRCGC
jgi:hypothetical protein